MTIEHMPDGTKQFTDAQGVVTKHADFSAVLHYQQTGQRLAYDVPGGAPNANQGTQEADPTVYQDKDGKNAIDRYKDRCRTQGKARAARLVGGK